MAPILTLGCAVTSYCIVGLGYGDEGKGAVVDALCAKNNVACVVKYSGGHQAGHRVVVGDKDHVFSQYGAGSLAGAGTILGPEFIIEPMAMRKERNALDALGGNTTIHIHPDCPVTTRYHRAFNRLTESLLNHGSCGVGVGATRWTDNLGIGVTYADLSERKCLLEKKLRRLRSFLLAEATQAIGEVNSDHITSTMGTYIREQMLKFEAEFDSSLSDVADELCFCPGEIFQRFRYSRNSVVFEGSQGVLLDEWYGDHPHTTWSTVTTRNAIEFAKEWVISPLKVVGVMRSYLTRHGAGGLGDERYRYVSDVTDPGKSDFNNKANKWQGRMRHISWDSGTLDRSISIAKPHLLAVNHLDCVEFGDVPHVDLPVIVEGYGVSRDDHRVKV